MTDWQYEEMTLCTKENIEEPCNEHECIYYKECLLEWENMK